MCFPLVILFAFAVSPTPTDGGSFVRLLRLIQHEGTREALIPENDQLIKGRLAKAIAKDGAVTFNEVEGLMTPETFNRIAGHDGTLDSNEIALALEATTPETRLKLIPSLRAHADSLATSFDMIDEVHRRAGTKLARWIASNYQPGTPITITVVCTGNSRRSIMGSSMGNLAAAYVGMPEVRFHSGGTAPTAFNPRTVDTLRSIGFRIDPTNGEAPRSEPKTANPIYRVTWGDGFETLEFSKHYADPANPATGFAALMVCGEADQDCPFVKGAALRISMPYLDPKIFDNSEYESAKYAERRDDIGRLMLSVLLQARAEIREKRPASD
jgi:hypothetical protein